LEKMMTRDITEGMTLPERVKYLRLRRGLTVGACAQMAGISRSSWHRLARMSEPDVHWRVVMERVFEPLTATDIVEGDL
jgi:transcriptional regulator with XRE-family HTH domain